MEKNLLTDKQTTIEEHFGYDLFYFFVGLGFFALLIGLAILLIKFAVHFYG
jgi:hypothetical protein